MSNSYNQQIILKLSFIDIWCDIFKQNQISIDTNIFTIGGHSLLLMQLLYRYKTEFHLETNALSINDLFQHPTIVHHAQLIHQSINITDKILMTISGLRYISLKVKIHFL